MKALRFHRFGPPSDVLQLDDVPLPELGPEEVRIRLTHRCINPADLATVKGTYGKRPELPAIGGNEGVGVVENVGTGVSDLEIGQRVVPISAGPTWQEQLVSDADRLLPIPDGIPDETAAQVVVNPLTAWLLLESVPSLATGDVILLSAGASAVARCVAQLAIARGLKTVHVVRSKTHLDKIQALGGRVVIADGNNEQAHEALRKVIGDRHAAAAFDPVSGDVGALLLHALAEGGTQVVYGALSGRPLPASPASLIYRNINIKGLWRTRWVEMTPLAQVKVALRELLTAIEAGTVSLPVEGTYDLSDWQPAVAQTTSHGRWGKVLLTG